METLWHDLRFGLRTLLKKPGFTAIAALCLALGIGANTIIFSMVNALLIRPLPWPDQDRLIEVAEAAPELGRFDMSVAFPNYLDWKASQQSFEQLAAYDEDDVTLAGTKEPEQLEGGQVTPDLFPLLGIAPALGRTLEPGDDKPGQDGVVVLSHRLWQRRYGGDPKILGQDVVIDGRPHTVVGVMPAGFAFRDWAQLWTPLVFDAEAYPRGRHTLRAIGRLKPGVSLEQARAELTTVARRLEQAHADSNRGLTVQLTPFREARVGELRPILYLLTGCVGFVLLIACANVANLMLARVASRQKEMAIRLALGASRGRAVRQMLTESVLVALAGAALGVLVAMWGLDLMVGSIPLELPTWIKFTLDARVLGFTVALAVVTGVIFGLAPALQASSVSLQDTLKDSGASTTGGYRRSRLRSALIVSQVALSLVLLIGAMLMIRSFLKLQAVEPGLDPRGVLTMKLALTEGKYLETARIADLYARLIERIEALPGVQSAAAVSHIPLGGSQLDKSVEIDGLVVPDDQEAPVAQHIVVTDRYFETLHIPVQAGRIFASTDGVGSQRVAVVNETFVKRYSPEKSPLGRRIRLDADRTPDWITIVGVVGDVRARKLGKPATAQLYTLHPQAPVHDMTITVRTASDPSALAPAIRKALQALDPDQALADVMTMEQVVSRSVWQQRLFGSIFGIFASVALLLASVGIFGVVSYTVAHRTKEIGIRLALGAQRRDVLRLVLGQSMRPVAIGVGLGLVGAFAVSRAMAGLLFGVTPNDPVTWVALTGVLVGVALLASYLPARRSMRVDPTIALRSE